MLFESGDDIDNDTAVFDSGAACEGTLFEISPTNVASRTAGLTQKHYLLAKFKSLTMAHPLQVKLSASLTPDDISKAYTSFSGHLTTYETRIGQACRSIATQLPAFIPTFSSLSSLILDDACGTGAVTFSFLAAFPTTCFHAVDASEQMVALMEAQVQPAVANRTIAADRISVAQMDAQALDFRSAMFDAAIMNFGLHFLPDPTQGISEMHRVLKTGGTALVSVWNEIGSLRILWEVQRRVAPKNPVLEMPVLDRWFDGTLLEKTMREGGFEHVKLERLAASLWGDGLRGFVDVMVQNFVGLVGSQWDEGEMARLEEVTMQVLEEEEDDDDTRLLGVVKGEGGKRGVKMVAWVAVAKK